MRFSAGDDLLTQGDNSAVIHGAGDPSVTLLRFISEGLRGLGADWRAIFRSCGIDPDALDEVDARFSRSSYDQLWPAAAKWTRDVCIGLHVAERTRPHAVNILGYLLMSSSTLGEGMERAIHYHRVIAGDDWFEIENRRDSILIRLNSGNFQDEALAQHTEYFTVLLLKLFGWDTGDDIHATEVRFAHARLADEAEYQRVLRCPIRFRCPESVVLLSGAAIGRPSLNANPEIAQIHQEFAESQLAELEEASLARGVAKHLASLLERGPCDLLSVAKCHHMSPRTLQRRLAEEGTTFQKILESLRRDLCLRHLKSASASLSEIAYLGGFADASSFNRAVRRWTGQTPHRYRQTQH